MRACGIAISVALVLMFVWIVVDSVWLRPAVRRRMLADLASRGDAWVWTGELSLLYGTRVYSLLRLEEKLGRVEYRLEYGHPGRRGIPKYFVRVLPPWRSR